MSLTFSKSSRVRAANISLQSAMAAFRACSGETLYAVEELNENANSGVGNVATSSRGHKHTVHTLGQHLVFVIGGN